MTTSMQTIGRAASSSLNPAHVYAKVSRRIMPFLIVAFIVAFLDRINIGFAQFQMKADIGISDSVYGLAAGIFFIGYVLFEVPSNLLLHKIGARRTFSRIMICWGIVSVGMAFVTNSTTLFVLRFLLGAFEAGFFPGIILYLSYWYPARYRAARTSWIFAAMASAGVVGGVAAGTIMSLMDSLFALRGWQWLFIVEGLPAIILGFIALYWLTDNPERATWLSRDERDYIMEELDRDRTGRDTEEVSTLRSAMKSPLLYLMCFVYFTLCSVTMALNFWLPTLVKETGVRSLTHTGLLVALPYVIGVVAIIYVARTSDRLRERRLHYVFSTTVGCAALVTLALASPGVAGTLILLSIAVAGTFSALPVFWSIPHEYLSRNAAAGGLALISSVGQLGSFFSPALIGWTRTATGGHMQPALLSIAMLSLIGAAFVYLYMTPRHRVDIPMSRANTFEG
jgi:D-galactonate transporter